MADGIVGMISVGDGATFTPSVSNEGVLSWSNNKNLPNPADFDIPAEIINSGAMTPGSESGTIAFGGNDVAVTGWADKANVNSPAFSGTPTAPTPESSDDSTKLATTEFVNSRLSSYLPLTGGTMTGTIKTSKDPAFSQNIDSSYLIMLGGTAYEKGASISLSGKDRTGAEGIFVITANNGSQSKSLRGYADGTLTWNGANVITSAGGTFNGGVYFNNTHISAYSPSFTKGDLPSTAMNVLFSCFYDKNKSFSLASRMCGVGGGIGTDGTVTYGIQTLKNVVNGTSIVAVNLKYPLSGSTCFYSTADNATDLGESSHRWKQLYAGTTTIATSDERLKDNIEAIPDDVLDAWGEVNWYQYQFKDSIAEKGENARLHTGAIAQRIESVFESHGLDANRYGLLCYDEWEAEEEQKDSDGNVVQEAREAGNRYSLRYEEALAMEAAYQRRRADRLEERIARLEALNRTE